MPEGSNAIVLGVKEPGKYTTIGRSSMASRVRTVAFSGIDVLPIDVQVQMAQDFRPSQSSDCLTKLSANPVSG